MKAKDLAEELLKNPEYDVTISVDISKTDADARAYGEEIHEVMVENNDKSITIITSGYVNTK